MHVHVYSVIETRQGKATTPKDSSSFLPREKRELPQVGFKPVTFCILGRHSTKATTSKDNSSLFPKRKKEEQPQVGFEPATFCVLGRYSTNRATKAAKLGRPNLIHVG